MKIWLIRHGAEDGSVRGGWSETPLTAEGRAQSLTAAERLAAEPDAYIARIFSSDLLRAAQTARIISDRLSVPVTYLSQFREVNNGVLAGMANERADREYPGLYWRTLAFDEHYPGGESPHEFYDRISAAWGDLVTSVRGSGKDAALVTHGGVINVIMHIVDGMPYSNQTPSFCIGNAEYTAVEV